MGFMGLFENLIVAPDGAPQWYYSILNLPRRNSQRHDLFAFLQRQSKAANRVCSFNVTFFFGFLALNLYVFGDMTLVTYRRKYFSIREDDSCAHFSPTLYQYNRLDRLVWVGLGFLSLCSI